MSSGRNRFAALEQRMQAVDDFAGADVGEHDVRRISDSISGLPVLLHEALRCLALLRIAVSGWLSRARCRRSLPSIATRGA
jgi:hypothetical protein